MLLGGIAKRSKIAAWMPVSALNLGTAASRWHLNMQEFGIAHL
jgi:hypothetical protein